MPDQPADALGQVLPRTLTVCTRHGAGAPTTREIRIAPSMKPIALMANGIAVPDREQERTDRRREELVDEQERALHPGVGDA